MKDVAAVLAVAKDSKPDVHVGRNEVAKALAALPKNVKFVAANK